MKKFEDREVNLWRSKMQSEFAAAMAEQVHGVDEFEKNLAKLGIDQHINMDEAIRRQEEKAGIPPGQIQNFSYAATMNKIKETKKNSDFAGRERERRRRKMHVDQINATAKLASEKHESELIAKLLSQTQVAAEQAYTARRAAACKALIQEERRGRALQTEAARTAQIAEAEAQAIEENKVLERERAVEDGLRRQEVARAQREIKAKKRAVNIEIGSALVDLIMDLQDETFEIV